MYANQNGTCVHAGERNRKGESPLDVALNENTVDVAYYLINLGYGIDDDKTRLVLQACRMDKLDVLKKLTKQHKIDPNGKP